MERSLKMRLVVGTVVVTMLAILGMSIFVFTIPSYIQRGEISDRHDRAPLFRSDMHMDGIHGREKLDDNVEHAAEVREASPTDQKKRPDDQEK